MAQSATGSAGGRRADGVGGQVDGFTPRKGCPADAAVPKAVELDSAGRLEARGGASARNAGQKC